MRKNHMYHLVATILYLFIFLPFGANATEKRLMDHLIEGVEKKVIAWRRDIHQHPELSNREFRTSALVAKHLKELGFDHVDVNVAHTGVVGILVGGRPGPVVALRADMDALPVLEKTGLPFASQVQTMFNGKKEYVMHACGHDAHTAILMGVAEVLAGMREQISGSVKFIFQPAEEGAPKGEEGGAALMIKEGVLTGDYAPEAIFGLHVWPGKSGSLSYRKKGTMAAADGLSIKLQGVQTHGARPWAGIDPIVVAGQVLTALQLIPSRQLNVTVAPAVVTIGSIHGGNRGNIIPETVEMEGTIRTFDPEMRKILHKRLYRTVTKIAEASGATAEVKITPYAPVTYNDSDLTNRMLPALKAAAGVHGLSEIEPIMGAEDFAHYQEKIPGIFFFLGVSDPEMDLATAPANHSPYFTVSESSLKVGVRALSYMAVRYLDQSQEEKKER